MYLTKIICTWQQLDLMATATVYLYYVHDLQASEIMQTVQNNPE